ncbi:hypothetical protein Hanom_Chr11g00972001 [Helianthus anomalus]
MALCRNGTPSCHRRKTLLFSYEIARLHFCRLLQILQLPTSITRFCKETLDEYAVYISQMHPLGLAKLRHFEYASLSLGFLPKKLIFRAFYTMT